MASKRRQKYARGEGKVVEDNVCGVPVQMIRTQAAYPDDAFVACLHFVTY